MPGAEHDAILAEMEVEWAALRDATWALTDEAIEALDRGEQVERLNTTAAELEALNEHWAWPWRDVPLADAKEYVLRAHEALRETIRLSPVVRRELVLGCYPGHLDDLLALASLPPTGEETS